MGLEENGLTVASHSVMVVTLILLIARSLLTFVRGLGAAAVDHGLLAVISIDALALIIERSYYILARVLRPRGIDMWSMHPAPEALSFVVGLGFYTIMIPMIRAREGSRSATVRRVFFEVCCLVLLWGLIGWLLY